jgi:hypothetical protein
MIFCEPQLCRVLYHIWALRLFELSFPLTFSILLKQESPRRPFSYINRNETSTTSNFNCQG